MMIIRRAAVFFLTLAVIPVTHIAVAQTSNFFDIQKVDDGVYAAIAKPGVLCNSAVIVTNDGVIVVDTHLRPSWAKDLIKEIGRLTDKPVRYVINTHWHGDHTQGNKACEAAFPRGTEFISHHNTREDIIAKAIPSIKTNLDSFPVQIGRLKSRLESDKASGRRDDERQHESGAQNPNWEPGRISARA